jgi:hypothetical protein
MPELNDFVSTSFRTVLSLPSVKRRFPPPKTTGWTMSRYSSMRSCCMSVRTSSPLPATKESSGNNHCKMREEMIDCEE